MKYRGLLLRSQDVLPSGPRHATVCKLRSAQLAHGTSERVTFRLRKGDALFLNLHKEPYSPIVRIAIRVARSPVFRVAACATVCKGRSIKLAHDTGHLRKGNSFSNLYKGDIWSWSGPLASTAFVLCGFWSAKMVCFASTAWERSCLDKSE